MWLNPLLITDLVFREDYTGGFNPPLIVIHANQVDALPDSYQRYLMNYLRKALKMMGIPIKVNLREAEPPLHQLKRILKRHDRKISVSG